MPGKDLCDFVNQAHLRPIRQSSEMIRLVIVIYDRLLLLLRTVDNLLFEPGIVLDYTRLAMGGIGSARRPPPRSVGSAPADAPSGFHPIGQTRRLMHLAAGRRGK